MKYSAKAVKIGASPTLSITDKASEMKKSGIDVVSFGAGEPDFDTPLHVRQAAINAINNGFTRYTNSSGLEVLRKAIADKLKNENNLTYDPSQIVVSNGAKHALFNTFTALLNDGDEVIVPAPYWVSYTEMIKLIGGVPKIVVSREENNFIISREEILNAITDKTKAILLNSPCNPSGAVYSHDDIKEIAKIAVDNDLFVISDEIYENLIFDNNIRPLSIASLGKEIYERTITINGLSKSFAMTGWRIGYSACNNELAQVISNVQSHCASNPNSIAQMAAYAAYTHEQSLDSIEEMRKEFEERRNYIYERVSNIPLLSAVKPSGSFYIFVNISKLCGKKINNTYIDDANSLCKILLDECKVACIPGNDFGFSNYMRLSFATSLPIIQKGMDRIDNFIKKYYC